MNFFLLNEQSPSIYNNNNQCNLWMFSSLNFDGFNPHLLKTSTQHNLWKYASNNQINLDLMFDILLSLNPFITANIGTTLNFNYGLGNYLALKLNKSFGVNVLQSVLKCEHGQSLWKNFDDISLDCVTYFEKELGNISPHTDYGTSLRLKYLGNFGLITLNHLIKSDGDERNGCNVYCNMNIWEDRAHELKLNAEGSYEKVWDFERKVTGGFILSIGFDHFLSIKCSNFVENVIENSKNGINVVLNNSLWKSDIGVDISSKLSFQYTLRNEIKVRTILASIILSTIYPSKMLVFNISETERTVGGNDISIRAYYEQTIWTGVRNAYLSVNVFIQKSFMSLQPYDQITYGLGVFFRYWFNW